jgi:hypothetical protein
LLLFSTLPRFVTHANAGAILTRRKVTNSLHICCMITSGPKCSYFCLLSFSGLSVRNFSNMLTLQNSIYILYFIPFHLLKCHGPRDTDSQNATRNDDTKTVNRSSGNVSQFRYFGQAVTNQTSGQSSRLQIQRPGFDSRH